MHAPAKPHCHAKPGELSSSLRRQTVSWRPECSPAVLSAFACPMPCALLGRSSVATQRCLSGWRRRSGSSTAGCRRTRGRGARWVLPAEAAWHGAAQAACRRDAAWRVDGTATALLHCCASAACWLPRLSALTSLSHGRMRKEVLAADVLCAGLPFFLRETAAAELVQVSDACACRRCKLSGQLYMTC